MSRDGSTENEVRARLASQCPDSERISKADFVLESVDGADVESKARHILELI